MSVIAGVRNSGVSAGRELTVTHYFQVHEFAESSQFSHNASCPAHETTDNRLPSLTTRASDYTVTMTKRILDKCYHIVRTMVDGVWNGSIWLAECTWNGVKKLIEWAWDTAKWLAECLSNKSIRIAELARNGPAWIVRPFINAINYVTEVAL